MPPAFGNNLGQQHLLEDPKDRSDAEEKDWQIGWTDHSEAAFSNWSTDLKLCNDIE